MFTVDLKIKSLHGGVGFKSTTNIFFRVLETGEYEVRQGHSLFNSVKSSTDPFSYSFNDGCYSVGVGPSLKKALKNLAKNQRELSDGLWA